jgi:large subunit ribosomal protein L13
MANNINWKVVDATDMIMGRMCSKIAKLSLFGEHILIINAKDAVVSGRRNQVLEKYVHLRHIRTANNPRKGPFHDSRPDTFIRQKVKGMLPKNIRGRDALARVHVYIAGIPDVKAAKYKNSEPITFTKASVEHLGHSYVTVADICMNMGWSGASRENIKSL